MFDRESEGQNLFIDIFFSNFVADTMLNNLRVFFFIVHLFYSELCTKNYFCVCVIEWILRPKLDLWITLLSSSLLLNVPFIYHHFVCWIA